MTDSTPHDPAPAEEQPYYTETVVEYADNSRQRIVLVIILVLLFLLLAGAVYAVLRLTPGKGAPLGTGDVPPGITWVRSIYGWGNAPGQQLRAPTDVAIGADGTIWVLSGHDTIAGFNPDGTARRVVKPSGVASLEGIAVGDNGNLYVADFGGQIVEYDTNGAEVDKWKVELPNEVDMRNGQIAVAAAKGIAVFTPDGKMVLQIGGVRGWGKDQFDLPHGIVFAPDGKIFVADTQNRRVKALTSTGRVLWTLGEAPDRSRPGVADTRSQSASMTNNPFLLPSGMTMDGSGRLVLVDPFRFRIAVIDAATGKIAHEPGRNGKQGRQAFYGEFGQGDGFFAYPTGISYDPNRDWFAVADTANDRVQIVRIPGSGGSALAPIVAGFSVPMCVFCLPLLLLLAAVVVAVMRRRRRAQAAPDGGEPAAA